MIDWARISELRTEIGAEDFSEVIEIFFEEVESEISSLRLGCEPAHLEAKFHILKGSALNLGFQEFAEHCEIGEKAAAHNHHSQIDMQAVFKTYDMSKAEFWTGLKHRVV